MITVHDENARSIVNACLEHMRGGGTHIAGQLLANQLQNECNAQAIEDARRKEIRDAVAQANIDKALKKSGTLPAKPEEVPAAPANDLVPAAPVRARRAKR